MVDSHAASGNVFFVHSLLRHGAIPCAESGDKIPIRARFETEDEARAWLGATPGSVWEQYGVVHACQSPMLEGVPSGFVVPPTSRLTCLDVDIDACKLPGFVGTCTDPDCKHHDGYRELDALERALGDLPATLATRSPRGGLHLWFLVPAGHRTAGSGKVHGTLAIDCKGNGGAYVGELGRGRHVIPTGVEEPAELPEAWLEALPVPGAARDQAGAIDGGKYEPDQSWVDYCTTHAVAGERDTGLQVSLQVKLLGKEAGRRELRFAPALAVALEHYNPRCEPPFSDAEFSARFRAWYNPAEQELAEAFARGVFVDAFPALAWSPSADEASPVTVAPTETEVRHSLLAATAAPQAAQKPSLALVAKFFAYDPRYRGRIRWDEFGQVVRLFGLDLGNGLLDGAQMGDAEITALRIHYGQLFLHEPAKEMAVEALMVAAKEHSYHPVRDYLRAQHAAIDPKTSPAAAELLIAQGFEQVLGERTPIEHAMLRCTLLAACRRVLDPGCQVDTVLVLIGAQGLFKSSFFRALFGRGWFSDSKIDFAQKDAAINLLGVWCTELAELASVRRDQIELTRQFVSSGIDRFRAPYDRVARDHARQGVLVGTSNECEILNDPEGHRRWWPLLIASKVNLDALRAWRNALWGLAMVLVAAEAPHHLDDEQEAALRLHQADFVEQHPWAEALTKAARGKALVRTTDLLRAGLGMNEEQAQHPGNHRTAARLLRRLGFVAKKSHGARLWQVPEDIANMPPENVFGGFPTGGVN